MTRTLYQDTTEGFFAINDALAAEKAQRESVKGKDTPFRVEFRFPRGSKAWRYFETYEDAAIATHVRCNYTIFGTPYTESPRSQQIQIKGPRGGWKKFTPNSERNA